MNLQDPAVAVEFVEEVISSWREGAAEPDANQVLEMQPELQNHRELALDLLYEDYCLRCEHGEPVDASTICGHPTLQNSWLNLVDVHEEIEGNPLFDVGMDNDDWPGIGDTFIDWVIVAELGRGAMARVFLARQPNVADRFVALKVSRYSGEAQTLGRLDHPHITPIFDALTDPETQLHVVSMPFFGASTLVDLMQAAHRDDCPPERGDLVLRASRRREYAHAAHERTVPPDPSTGSTFEEAVLRIGQQLADALAFSHEKHVLHRDLKPSNVVLTTNGRPKLLDFNLSSDLAGNGRVGGTVPYMPAEQIEVVFAGAEAEKVTAQSDLFSLGVILYELLTGKPPYGEMERDAKPKEAALKMLYRQQRSRPAPIRRFNPRVDRRSEELIMSCLELDPANRPRNAADLAHALDAQLEKAENRKRFSQRGPLLGLLAAFIVSFGFAMGVGEALKVDEIETIRVMISRGECDAAFVRITKLALDDDSAQDALLLRAICHARAGNLEDAERDFARLPRFVVRDERIANIYSYVLLRLNSRSYRRSAASVLRENASVDSSLFVQNNYGLALTGSIDLRQRALLHFEQLAEKHPNSIEVRINVALMRMDLHPGDVEQHRKSSDDLEFVLMHKRGNQLLHRNAAQSAAVCYQATGNEEMRSRLINNLELAIVNGARQKTLRRPLFSDCGMDTIIAKAPENNPRNRAEILELISWRIVPPSDAAWASAAFAVPVLESVSVAAR
ncbi:MAG: serine/threonine-protein kinase [Pirellulaceae bacterium]|jgi:serine/threonine protein kinase|nr:serine/threonine-protein kinase [Pirellulaceae bacterium]MDP7019273.1 serine/threonine-protein kinase [Pirellulaceae bacterium]